jgi:hypothetical protein
MLLNGPDDDDDAEAFVDAMIDETRVEVLGEVLDLAKGEATLNESTIAKLRRVREILEQQTTSSVIPTRVCCAVFGVLLFASAVVGISCGDHWLAMTAFRAASAYGAATGWSSGSSGTLGQDSTLAALTWLTAVLEARPFDFVRAEEQREAAVDCSLTIDASSWGVGVVAEVAGRTSLHAIPWSSAEHGALQQHAYASTRTEPCGAVKAVLVCVPASARHVHIRTDHLGLVLSSRDGAARCWSYNETFRRLRLLRPSTRFTWTFVPGMSNTVADRLSRGALLSPLAAPPPPPPPPFVQVGTKQVQVRVGHRG